MTTDTIKALRDALTECLMYVSDTQRAGIMAREALALTADASEDAPDADTVHAWFARKSEFGPWLECSPSTKGARLFTTAAARPAPVAAPDPADMAEPDAYMYKTGGPWDIAFSRSECGAAARIEPLYFITESQKRQFFREAPVAATPAPDDLLKTKHIACPGCNGVGTLIGANDGYDDADCAHCDGVGRVAAAPTAPAREAALAEMESEIEALGIENANLRAELEKTPAAPIAEVTRVSSLTREQWTHVNNAAFALAHFEKSQLSDALAEVCAACEIHPAAEHAKPEPSDCQILRTGFGQGVRRAAEIVEQAGSGLSHAAIAGIIRDMQSTAKPEPVVMGVAQDENPVAHAKLAEGEFELYCRHMDGLTVDDSDRAFAREIWAAAWQARGQQAGAVDGEAG